MRVITTGIDAKGRSCLLSDVEYSSDMQLARAGVEFAVLGGTTENVPPARPAGDGTDLDLGVGPGLTRWVVVRYEPHLFYEMHHTDTIDFDFIAEGTVVLGLDDGEHELKAGDAAIVTGVDHTWRAGPEGTLLSIFQVGTPPRA